MMAYETDEDAAWWVERSKREIPERRRREREAARPAQVRQHVCFALALSWLSADRTRRFLKWLRSQSGWHHAGGGGG